MSQMLYLRLEGLDGEEPIGDDTQNAIAIVDYSHAIGTQLAPGRPSVGEDASLRRSRCHHGPFVVKKAFDKTSPKLFAAALRGVIFNNAVLYSCTQDIDSLTKSSKPEPFLSIVMTDALIVDFSYGYVNNWQMEKIEFSYASIGWHTKWKNPETGDNESLDPVGWDGRENKLAEVPIDSTVEWSSSLL